MNARPRRGHGAGPGRRLPIRVLAGRRPRPQLPKAVHVVNDLDTIKYAVFTDAPAPRRARREYNTLRQLATGKLLTGAEGDNSETHLSSGPNGVFLSYKFFTAGNNRVGLRKFDPATNTFGGPVYADGENPIDNNSAGLPAPLAGPGRAAPRGVAQPVRRQSPPLRPLRRRRREFASLGTVASKETFIDPIVEAGPVAPVRRLEGHRHVEIRVVVLDPQPETVPGEGGDPSPGRPRSRASESATRHCCRARAPASPSTRRRPATPC